MGVKIDSAGGTKSAGPVRKSGTASGASGTGFSTLLGGVEDAAPSSVQANTAVGGLEALLAAQVVGDAMEERAKKRRVAERGNNILDKLEALRDGLLTGRMSKQKLIELAQALREPREKDLPPEAEKILDEIELRAAVELAKLNV